MIAWNQKGGKVYGWRNFGTGAEANYGVANSASDASSCVIGANSNSSSSCFFPAYAIIHTVAWIDDDYSLA